MKIRKNDGSLCKYFKSGDFDQDKESQGHWIIDINP